MALWRYVSLMSIAVACCDGGRSHSMHKTQNRHPGSLLGDTGATNSSWWMFGKPKHAAKKHVKHPARENEDASGNEESLLGATRATNAEEQPEEGGEDAEEEGGEEESGEDAEEEGADWSIPRIVTPRALVLEGIKGVASAVAHKLKMDEYSLKGPLSFALPLFDNKCDESLMQTSASNDASVGANASTSDIASASVQFKVDPNLDIAWSEKKGEISVKGDITFSATFSIEEQIEYKKEKTWVQTLAVFPGAVVMASISIDLGMGAGGSVSVEATLPVKISFCINKHGQTCKAKKNSLTTTGLSSKMDFEGHVEAHAILKIGLFVEAMAIASAGAEVGVEAKYHSNNGCTLDYTYAFKAKALQSASNIFNTAVDSWNTITGLCVDGLPPFELSVEGRGNLGKAGCGGGDTGGDDDDDDDSGFEDRQKKMKKKGRKAMKKAHRRRKSGGKKSRRRRR